MRRPSRTPSRPTGGTDEMTQDPSHRARRRADAVMAACSSSRRLAGPASAAARPPVRRRVGGRRSAAAAGTTVALADSALGKILVDGQGKTLYMFTPDEGGHADLLRQVRDELAGAHRHRHRPGAVTAHRGATTVARRMAAPRSRRRVPALLLRRGQGRRRHQRPGPGRQVVRRRRRRRADQVAHPVTPHLAGGETAGSATGPPFRFPPTSTGCSSDRGTCRARR